MKVVYLLNLTSGVLQPELFPEPGYNEKPFSWLDNTRVYMIRSYDNSPSCPCRPHPKGKKERGAACGRTPRHALSFLFCRRRRLALAEPCDLFSCSNTWLIPHYRRAFPKSEDDRPEVFR